MAAQVFLCTRPRLASRLIAGGIEARATKNPFTNAAPYSKAWEITLNTEAAAIISDFFSEIGKPIPNQIAAYLYRMNKGAAHEVTN